MRHQRIQRQQARKARAREYETTHEAIKVAVEILRARRLVREAELFLADSEAVSES